MTDYTRTESEVIRQAWRKLATFADTHSGSAAGALEQIEAAAKEEARNVGNLQEARALLLQTLADTCDPDSRMGKDPAELWGVRGPHRDVIAFTWMHQEGLIERGVTYAARQAANVNRQATRRTLDALAAK